MKVRMNIQKTFYFEVIMSSFFNKIEKEEEAKERKK